MMPCSTGLYCCDHKFTLPLQVLVVEVFAVGFGRTAKSALSQQPDDIVFSILVREASIDFCCFRVISACFIAPAKTLTCAQLSLCNMSLPPNCKPPRACYRTDAASTDIYCSAVPQQTLRGKQCITRLAGLACMSTERFRRIGSLNASPRTLVQSVSVHPRVMR